MLKLTNDATHLVYDYGCIVYGSVRKSYLQMLDPIHNLGAFKTSVKGARCISVVRTFAHGAIGRRIDPSWLTH